MIRQLLLLALLVICFGSPSAFAQKGQDKTLAQPSTAPLIEEITVNVHPVFDETNPKENNWLFRLVNLLHINTKKRIIEKDLTFKKGERLDEHLLKESERILRARRYFANATIKTVEKDNKQAQDAETKVAEPSTRVQVDVREVWTLVPKITYSSAGGNTHYGYGLYDSNFLGLGKTVKVEHSSTVERTSDIVAYRDANFANQKELAFAYSDNSDGKAQEFHFSNPFKSIRTPWSAGVDFEDFAQEDTLYNAGKEVERFGHENTSYRVFYGRRLDSSDDDRTHRFIIGIDDVEDTFFTLPTTDSAAPLPFDRNYTIAWVEYAYIHNKFLEASNIQQINRIEDINLGSEFHVRIGQVTAEDTRLDQTSFIKLDYEKAFRLSPSQLLLAQLTSSGFYKSTESTQSISQGNVSYHWSNFERGQFYILGTETYGENLFMDTPLELGGDTGLRGYPARFAAGDRLSLLTVEQRYFGEREWFSLFHLGAAVFYDQGRVWGDSAVEQDYQGTLRDVGIGLRISGTRTGGRDDGIHNVGHIDLSYPLDGGSEIDKYQLSVRIKTSF